MKDANESPLSPARDAPPEPPEVEVVIEIPRGSFLKRGSTGHIDFISPLPCPFNYGSLPRPTARRPLAAAAGRILIGGGQLPNGVILAAAVATRTTRKNQ